MNWAFFDNKEEKWSAVHAIDNGIKVSIVSIVRLAQNYIREYNTTEEVLKDLFGNNFSRYRYLVAVETGLLEFCAVFKMFRDLRKQIVFEI